MNSFRKYVFALFSLIISHLLFSQQNEIDSLSKVISRSKVDTNKVILLKKLAVTIASSGDMDKALPYFEEGLTLSKKLNYHFGIAVSLNNLGKIYLNKSDYPKALDYFIQSLEEAERYNIKPGIAAALGNMGIVYDSQGDYDKALRYHFKSLKVDEELGNLRGVAHSYNSIGNIYFSKKNIPKVLECYNKSLEIKRKIGDIEGEASTLANIGNIYYYQHDYIKTREYYFKALPIFEEMNEVQAQTMLFTNISETYISDKNFKEALKYSKKSLELSLQLNALDEIKNAYHTLSRINEGMGDKTAALLNYKNYVKYKDSIFNDENRRRTVESEIKYHFSKKEMNTRIENERKQIILKEEAQKQRLIIYFGAGILLLVIIFAVYAFRSYRIKQKINQQLSQQKQEIMDQRDEIEFQKAIVDEKNKDLTDSINYAKRIQYTLLAHDHLLNENIPDHFVYFNPKDIVSGDFYWATKKEDRFYLAVCDSTGHGVPGAFMSLLSISFLNEAINERGILSPEAVLNYVRERLIESVSKEGQRDGFDGILICIEKNSKTITYAAAHNNPVLIKDNVIVELPCDKMPVGFNETIVPFSLHSTKIENGDVLYLFTDGFADQFGGVKGKKFKYKNLTELLCKIHQEDLNHQADTLSNTFDTWKGKLEQVDDVCIIGIRL